MVVQVGIVLGTRPEIIKNYSVVRAFRSRGVEPAILYTNQHSIFDMSGAIFADMRYQPTFVMDGPYSLGKAIEWVRQCMQSLRLELIVVNGDTCAALVGALAAMYEDKILAHVEAGLRSYDKRMFEERNRIVTDAIAHFLLTYTSYESDFLKQVPDLRGKIHCVGNTTVDVIADFSGNIGKPPEKNYAYVTLHRRELTEDKESLESVLTTIASLSERFLSVIFPVHPRTLDAITRHKIDQRPLSKIDVRPPLSAFESLSYEKYANIILTDSGCIQEEAMLFDVPCVTVRENTERHATIACGANIVSGFARERIISAVDTQLAGGRRRYPKVYGPPGAGERIADLLLEQGSDSGSTKRRCTLVDECRYY